jgi:hypothetical protein
MVCMVLDRAVPGTTGVRTMVHVYVHVYQVHVYCTLGTYDLLHVDHVWYAHRLVLWLWHHVIVRTIYGMYYYFTS